MLHYKCTEVAIFKQISVVKFLCKPTGTVRYNSANYMYAHAPQDRKQLQKLLVLYIAISKAPH